MNDLLARRRKLEQLTAEAESGLTPEQKELERQLRNRARDGRDASVRRVLKEGVPADAPDTTSKSPLHYAAQYGKESTVRLLLAEGANVNAENRDGKNALHFACEGNHVECCLLLLDGGTPYSLLDNFGKTPLDYASAGTRTLIEKHIKDNPALKKNNASVRIRTGNTIKAKKPAKSAGGDLKAANEEDEMRHDAEQRAIAGKNKMSVSQQLRELDLGIEMPEKEPAQASSSSAAAADAAASTSAEGAKKPAAKKPAGAAKGKAPKKTPRAAGGAAVKKAAPKSPRKAGAGRGAAKK